MFSTFDKGDQWNNSVNDWYCVFNDILIIMSEGGHDDDVTVFSS